MYRIRQKGETHQRWNTPLTLHQELGDRLSSVGLHSVVAGVLFGNIVDDERVFAAIFFEAILEWFISSKLHSIFLPENVKIAYKTHFFYN